jgi:hypothetical protein
VLIDLAISGALSSPQDFFQLLFQEIRNQLGICYIEPQEAARLFQESRLALSDFRQAFDYIVRSPESKVQGNRLLLLLDNADELAQAPCAPELFTDLIRLFSDATYIRHVTSQLDVVVTGSAPLYNQLLKVDFPRKLKHWYNIEVLPEDAAQALVAELPTISSQPDLMREILRCTGRHPYLLQRFMAHLEGLTSSGQPVTTECVEQAATACLQSREEIARWFYECFKAIEGQDACPVYAALAAAGQAMTWERIERTIQEQKPGDAALFADPVAVDRALDALLFHGLIRCDQTDGTDRYVITSELFRKWFVERQVGQDHSSLRIQLQETQENLRLVHERKYEYVMETDIPLDLIKRERQLEQQIADLEARLTQSP